MMLLKIRHLYFKHKQIGDVVLAEQERRARFGAHGAHPASVSTVGSSAAVAATCLHPAYTSSSRGQQNAPSVAVENVRL